MRSHSYSLRLRYVLSSVAMIALFGALASWQTSGANSPPADEPLAEQVEVNVPSTLRIAGEHTYSVEISLTSTMDEPVAGPIYLVIEGAAPGSLLVREPDGINAGDEPYFEVLAAKDELNTEQPKVSQTISFKSDSGALRSSERRKFELQYRLTREITHPVRQAARETEERPRLVRVPSGRPVASSGQSRPARRPRENRQQQNEREDADDEPEPAEERADRPREPFELKRNITDEQIARVMKIQDDWTARLMEKEGVQGTATAVNVDGDLVIRIYTRRRGNNKNLPKQIGGIPVEPKVVGRFRSLYQQPQDKRGRAGSGGSAPSVENPQRRFPRPIPIGVSGICQTLPVCGTGTIGCRLKADDGTLYALSNNHVFAGENGAPIGDRILQPGPLDNNCSFDDDNSIGTLAAFIPIDFDLFGSGFTFNSNRIDAAIARVTAATVSNSTPRGAYGTPNSHIVEARLGMKVQKMGRTTSYTTGRITALNVSTLVGYSNGLAFFVNQIEITKPFLTEDSETGDFTINFDEFGGPGDSGSLIVTRYGNNPVGLLYAGSLFFVLANPIDVVLDELSDELGKELSIDGAPSNAHP